MPDCPRNRLGPASDHTVENAAEALRTRTQSEGADLVIEAMGSASGLASTFELVRFEWRVTHSVQLEDNAQLRQPRVDMIPRLRVRNEYIHSRTKPARVIQTRSIDANALGTLRRRRFESRIRARPALVLTTGPYSA
jgi:hypothetical protein